MNRYWADRMARSLNRLSDKNIKAIEKQLRKYYGIAMNSVIEGFESTYNKLLASGKDITPADLYKLDKYWQMQGQVRQTLQKLGDKKISLLSKVFETNYFDIYYGINIEGASAFTTIDTASVKHIINQIWCADGKSWSQRIWDDVGRLQQVLNDRLIECVTLGKKPTELKKQLQEQFGVSYRRADSIARTEIAHIQTKAAQQRYQDYGIKEEEVWADEDERRCPDCGKIHKKRYPVGTAPLPLHPNCRCCVLPVVE